MKTFRLLLEGASRVASPYFIFVKNGDATL